MHCNSCAQKIEEELKSDVEAISVSYARGNAKVEFDENRISEERLKERIRNLGFEAITADGKTKKIKPGILLSAVIVILISLFVLYCLFFGLPFTNFITAFQFKIPESGEPVNLILLFAAGLLTGFHCVSMCGGFVVSYATKNALRGHKSFSQHLVYGGAKVISYALVGGIFGLVGGIIALSTELRGLIAILAGVFMIFYALSMFGLGFFRKFQFNPPKFLKKISSSLQAGQNNKGFYAAPFITGLLSGLFFACGPLQAMYVYAAGTGSFLAGAMSLAVFGLGTLPVMLVFCVLATVVSKKTTDRILKVSAVIVLILGLVMINRGLELMGSPLSFSSIVASLTAGSGSSGTKSVSGNGVQEITTIVNGGEWKPAVFVLKKGVPVKWTIDVRERTSCNKEILIKDYGLDIKLNAGINVVEFTPNNTGTVKWTCWMGMISGSFIVTETGNTSKQEIDSEIRNSSGSSGM